MLRTADDDMGQSKQPTLTPIFRKVAPLLVKQFQKGMKQVPPGVRKKALKALFKDVKLSGDPTAKKNHKMLRDILVKAIFRDKGWLEFVAEQILDGSEAELREVLAPAKTAGARTANNDVTSDILAACKRAIAGMQQFTDVTVGTAARGIGYVHATLSPDAYDDYGIPPGHTRRAVVQIDVSVHDDGNCDIALFTDLVRNAMVHCDVTPPGVDVQPQANAPDGLVGLAHVVCGAARQVLRNAARATSAATRTAGVIDSIYEGKYPTQESDFEGVEFPVSFKTMGQSDSWYRLDHEARETGFSDGTTITLDSAEDAVDLFSALSVEADLHEHAMDEMMFEDFSYDPEYGEYASEDDAKEAYLDEHYNEYHADDHEPAAILAEQLGLS